MFNYDKKFKIKMLEKGKPAHNKRYMLSAYSALRVPQKPSRASPFYGFLLHHIFAVAVNASHFLYRNRKNVIYLERYAK
jgi:hypothetical protein